MSAGTYLLIRFKNKKKLPLAVSSIEGQKQVMRWDAVDGYYHLIIKTDENAKKLADHIKKIDGFSELADCDIKSDEELNTSFSDEFNHSYILVETEKEKKQQLIESLKTESFTTFCSPVSGNFDIIAVIKGKSFDEIDRIVNEDIRQRDGVLRLKQHRVIQLDRI